ncbi:MAG: lipopolysaccharide biosynthesis protein [Marinifilaceae bacterium]
MTSSRTIKSFRNIGVSVSFFLLNLVPSFITRKVFIDHLGTELLGLNSTIVNLLGFLNLAELGISSAIAYALYRPLQQEDHISISRIVSLQGWFYRKISYFVIIGACILLLFFPAIFKKTDLDLWYPVSTFTVLLISQILSYWVNYTQIILTADQKEYKVTLIINSIKFIKVIGQILAIIYSKHGYIYWLILEGLGAIITSIFLKYRVLHDYPWLVLELKRGKEFKQLFPNIITKTKQLLIHRITFYVLAQTTPLVIFGLSNLDDVALYGNYMLIITGVSALLNAFFYGHTASIGNLIAEGNKERIINIFNELLSLRIWFASILIFCLYYLINPFVILWLGEEFILNSTIVDLIITLAFIAMTRVVDQFISGYGLYHDVWASITEMILNLGGSIILGYWFGIKGILYGVLISQIFINILWRPYFLFKVGINTNPFLYYKKWIKYILIAFGAAIISDFIIQYAKLKPDTILTWILYGSIICFIYSFINTVLFFIFCPEIRQIKQRLALIIGRRNK